MTEPAAAILFHSAAKSLLNDIVDNPPLVEEEEQTVSRFHFLYDINKDIKKTRPAFEAGDRLAAAEYLLSAALATLAGKSTLPKKSLLVGKTDVSTLYIKHPDGIQTTSWVEQRLAKIVPRIFDIR